MEITIPFQFKPESLNPQALSVLQDPHRFQVLNWHRKARKTTLAINQLIRWAAKFPAPFWYVGPSYGLAKDTIWNDPRMLPKYVPDWHNPVSTLIKKRETDLRVDFLQSGGQLYVYGADRPDLMRGPNPHGVVLDEYSVQKPQVWEEIIQPIMRANPKAWCWFLFTPRGKNHAFKAYQLGQREGTEWKSWMLKANESGVYAPDQLELARKEMLPHTFSQELMCEFLEGEGSVFRGVMEAATATPRKPQTNHIYVMGCDVAKVQDYTVMCVYDRHDNAQVYQERFNHLEWPYQKARIKAVAKHYNNALVVLDATGIGDPIADDLLRDMVAVEPFKITNESKKELIEKLAIWIDQKKFSMLPMEETFFEFDNFTYEMTSQGRIRYQAMEGFNDDIVIAQALAVSSLQPILKEVIPPPVNKIRQMYLESLKTFEHDDNENDYVEIE